MNTKEGEKSMAKETEEKKKKSTILEYLPYILTIILVLLIKRYVVSPIKVNGDSMNQTLKNGDIMILNIIDYRFHEIKRFDIVVVDIKKEYIIKRVIGLPGEKVEYKENQLYINDQLVEDPYGSHPTSDFSVTVPKNHYFVLGDNRTNSLDSRYFGAFPKNKILGKTSLILFPLDRMGIKK